MFTIGDFIVNVIKHVIEYIRTSPLFGKAIAMTLHALCAFGFRSRLGWAIGGAALTHAPRR